MANLSLPQFTTDSPSHSFKNLEGQKFHKLTIEKFIGIDLGRRQAWWLCRCDCGHTTYSTTSNLRRGSCKSCGCLRLFRAHRTTHGKTNTPEFRAYTAAKTRCVNPQAKFFNRYGGRGIEFRFDSFEEFYAELGDRPSAQHSLDRIDNEGHYERGNVKWATRIDQANNKANNTRLTRSGETDTLWNWARKIGIPGPRIWARLRRGWCDDCSLSTGTSVKCTHGGRK